MQGTVPLRGVCVPGTACKIHVLYGLHAKTRYDRVIIIIRTPGTNTTKGTPPLRVLILGTIVIRLENIGFSVLRGFVNIYIYPYIYVKRVNAKNTPFSRVFVLVIW